MFTGLVPLFDQFPVEIKIITFSSSKSLTNVYDSCCHTIVQKRVVGENRGSHRRQIIGKSGIVGGYQAYEPTAVRPLRHRHD